MGQKVCKCVQAERADGDRRDVFTLPVQSTADSPPPAGASDTDVGDNSDGGRKKRRFGRKFWRKGRRSAQADESDRSPRADVHEEVDENRDEGKKKKKKSFWKSLWRKNSRGAESEREESDRNPEETPELLNHTEELNKHENVIYNINNCQYKMGKMLSKGGNGSIYEATRVSDGRQVAVKIVEDIFADIICKSGHPYVLPREIKLHKRANEKDHVPEIIRLLDWEERYCQYVMVLEHPSPCMDLREFIESRGGKISEDLARIIMKQAVKAVIECFKRGVFHMDIKLENILINTETFDVKLINFDCASRLRKTYYRSYLGMFPSGSKDYWCPELIETGRYHALPGTVWSLGLILHMLLCGNLPDINTGKQINSKKCYEDDLTKDWCSLIHACLQKNPDQRIQIKDILLHKWFQVNSVEMISSCFEEVSKDQMQETPDVLNETDDLTEAGDLLTSHHSSDSSDEGFFTPALSLSDPHHTVSSGSDSDSVDSFHNTFGSVSDLLENNEDENVIYKINNCQYKMGKMLGKGGFGSVYEATRVSDGLQVAVKIVKSGFSNQISIPDHPDPLPHEIALHILASKGAKLSEIIRLLDWEERDNKYIMVLERPSPCMDLRQFINFHGGAIPENLAKKIMRQAIQAAIVCLKQDVFHGDMKLDNFLINTETFEVKLIDFGCGSLLNKNYEKSKGTWAYCCPDIRYALPATVWSLGRMVYRLVGGRLDGRHILHEIKDNNWYRDDVTKECRRFIIACMELDPSRRIHIKDILFHEWFQV